MFRQTLPFVTILACALTSCTPRVSQSFRVVPADPAYLLRSPDRQDTPFPDVLRRFNGFEPGRNWVDLPPSMGLRIENAYYEKGASRRGLTGYLGAEVARYSSTAAGLELLSVEPMKNRPEWDRPVQNLIAPAQQRLPFHRFFYEIVFSKRNNIHGAVLLAADTSDELDRLSAELSDPETVCHNDSPQCTVFPEACTVSVEMKVVLNGKPETVFWGSQLVSIVPHPVHRLEMKRLDRGRLVPVKIDVQDANALRLPLLPGDRIDWK